MVEIKQRFKGTCLLSPYSSSIKMEASRPSETSVIFYHTRRRQPSEDGAILIIEANKMRHFSALFGNELYMFWTDTLSIIRSLNTVFTTVGGCHAIYVDCLSETCRVVYQNKVEK